MNQDVFAKHCAAIRATLELAQLQLTTLEAACKPQPKARIELPAACGAFKEEDCARRCEEGQIDLGGMGGGPRSVMCKGCGDTVTPTV